MVKLLKTIIVSGLALFVLSGCGVATVYNVHNNPIEVSKNTTNNSIYKAIKMAGADLGWIVRKVKNGEAKATLNIRKHKAVAIINYTDTDYSITYINSNNLHYNKEANTIHKNYNGWILNLQRAIDVNLSRLSD